MRKYDELIFNGAKATNGTLANSAAAAVAGTNLTRIAITAHGLKVGSMIHIAGTTNYDGNHVVKAVATNTIDIEATFVAETPAGSETFVSGWKMPYKGTIAGIAAKLSAGVAAPEVMYINVDANRGADFDFTVDSHDFNTVTNWAEMYENPFPFDKDDIIMVTFANSTSKTFGVRLFLDKE